MVPEPNEAAAVDVTTSYVGRLMDGLTDTDRPAITWPGGTIRAAALRRHILRLGARLDADSVGPGSTVAVLTEPNHPAMLVARYAAHLLGAAVTHVRSMNPRTDEVELSVEEQVGVLRTTGSRLLVTDAASSGRARQLAVGMPDLRVIEIDSTPPPETGSWQPPARSVDAGACAVVDFTSGTSNAPKLVAQSWGARERLLTHLLADTDPARPSRLLSVTPISHTTAPMIDVALASGGSVVLHPGFEVDEVLAAIGEDRVSDLYLAVPHLAALLDDQRLAELDHTGLRRVIYSGTPSAPWRVRQAVAAFGPTLVQVYGTTETGGISALTPEDHLEPELQGTVGRPFPWVEVEIRDDAGTALPHGTGQVWVRSDTVMIGYVGDTPNPVVPGSGWVPTGDLGRWDRHGYLELLGRVGGVIKAGGLKIYPTAVENALSQHPAVRQAFVEGRRNNRDQREYVHATIACAPASCTPEELRAHVAGLLSEAHAPTEFTFWSGIPLTATGKPDHRRLHAANAS